ncbi:MAG: hypothetical protein BRD44_02530 [Bacteroidetes bacterium QS_7_67_15]|nr:MAG: hypothetical protein BRD44_02530 [Bacteroidetes bacterium QS_7_67_15]
MVGVLLGPSLGASQSAQAQTRGAGSIYSRFGLGELHTFSSSQEQAMGGGGARALRSLNYTAFANPALWSDQELTRLNIGGRYRRVNAQDAGGQTSRLSSGRLQSVQFSFPLYAGKLGVGVGFRPYSRTEYRVLAQPQTVPGDSALYQIDYRGEGGLRQISGGLGYRFGDVLSLGVRGDVIFGILESQRRTTFSNRARFAPTVLSTRTRLAGFTGTAGGLLSLSDVFRSEDALSIGATFTLPARLSGERARTIGATLDRDTLALGSGAPATGDEENRAEEGGLTIPLSAALGPLRDRLRFSVGAELLPAGNNRNATFFSRTAYRLGAYYEQTYVDAQTVFDDAPEETGINALAATGGVSLPTPLYGTRIDVGVEVGTRGTTDADLIRDVFYGLSLNVNLGERWFQRRKLR